MRRISTKRKKELYSISSLLFHLLVFVCLLVSLGTDSDDNNSAKQKQVEPAKKEGASPLEGFFASIKR